MTYDRAIIILIGVGLHVPYDLVSKQLRELCSLNDVTFNVAKRIVAKCLHDLGYVEECHINRVTFKCPHSILNQERVVLVHWQEVRDSSDGVDGSPEQKILYVVY